MTIKDFILIFATSLFSVGVTRRLMLQEFKESFDMQDAKSQVMELKWMNYQLERERELKLFKLELEGKCK